LEGSILVVDLETRDNVLAIEVIEIKRGDVFHPEGDNSVILGDEMAAGVDIRSHLEHVNTNVGDAGATQVNGQDLCVVEDGPAPEVLYDLQAARYL
jgi:hypothetical protein